MEVEDRIKAAMEKLLDEARFRPVDLHIDRQEGLRIAWADGCVSRYSFADLRRRCPCAVCKNERDADRKADRSEPDVGTASPDGSISLTVLPASVDRAASFADARLVGHYGIQISWADGHSTGIYDFRYLRAIWQANEDARADQRRDGPTCGEQSPGNA